MALYPYRDPGGFNMGMIAALLNKSSSQLSELLNSFLIQYEMIREQLLSSAPTEIHQLLEDNCVVRSLVVYGRSSFDIWDGELVTHGFSSKKDFLATLDALEKAWSNEVRIRKRLQPHSTELRFIAKK